MVCSAAFPVTSRSVWSLFVCLSVVLVFGLTTDANAQTTATYRLHKEASSTSGLFQLKPANPDSASLAIQTTDLKAAATGEKQIKAFDTQTGVPNSGGRIASGSAVTFALWMKKTAAFGTMYPRAKLLLNNSSGTSLCTATGTTALTTTLAKYTISCTTSANISIDPTDRFYLWVGVNLTTGDAANTFAAELDVEGTTGGNYDSTVTAPLPVAPPPIQYTYDESGRLVGVTDSNDQTAVYSYDATGNLTGIDRRTASATSIIEFTPNGGAVGTAVTIYGTGFSATAAQNTVKFNGTTAAVTSATASQIVASVPAGATSGAITVTSPAGTGTSSTPFTVGNPNAPTITGFTPNVGSAGAAVTIAGTNFQTSIASNKVAFNGVLSSVTSATATSLGTTVPAAAGSGRIAVTTPYGKAVSVNDFFVPPPPLTGTDIDSTGRIAFGETKAVSIATPNKASMLLFDGTAGQKASLNLSGDTIPGVTYVNVYKPNETPLMNTSVSQGGTGFIDGQTLPSTGTYTILVDPSGATDTGSVTLKLNDATDTTAAITAGGAPVTVTTTQPGQNARLTFTGTFGQKVSVSFSGNTIPNYTYVYLLKPDGSQLTSTYFAQGGTAFFDTQTLPVPGIYTILVDPQSTNIGSLTVKLNDTTEVTAGTITVGGAPVTMTTSQPGQNARLTFSGTAGGRISMNVTGVTIPGTYIYLRNPDGSQLAYLYSGTGGAFLDTQTLPATGTYTIFIDPSDVYTGSATLQLYNVPSDSAGAIISGTPVTVTTTQPGQNAKLTFTGTFGQRVSVNFSADTIPNYTYVYLLKPDGSQQTYTYFGQGGTAFFDTQTLPVPGTYTILVDPQGTNIGSLTVKLNDATDVTAGTITAGGAPVTATTTQPGQNARLTFSGTAGQRVSLNITGVTIPGASIYLINPDGSQLASTYTGTGGVFLDTKTLPATGTYTILVDPSDVYTGSATLQLYNVPSDNAGTIAVGTPVTVTATVPGHNQRLTFTGTFGQKVSVNFSADTIPNYTYVYLLKPDGSQLTYTYFGQGGTAFFDTQVLPLPGTYTILVDPQGTGTGNVTVKLNNAADAGTVAITAGGAPVTVTTAQPGQSARATFTGTAGQRISLNVTGVTIAGTYVNLLNPDGSQLASVYSGTGGAFMDTKVLPAAGTYTILVDPSDVYTGSATLQLYNVPSDNAGSIALGTPVTVTTAQPGQNAKLTFTGTFGQKVSVNFSANTIPNYTYVYLLRPDGSQLTYTYFGQGGTAFFDIQTLPVPGTYTILVDPQGTGTGSVTVKLNNTTDVAAGTISAGGTPVTVTTAQPGQNARLTFSGTAGNRVSLNITGVTMSGAYVYLLNPDGSQLGSVYTGTGGAFLDTQTLPATGTYTILVDPSDVYTGSATLQLYNVPADAAGTVTVGGTAASVTTTVYGQNGKVTFAGTAGQIITVHLTGNTMSSTTVSLLDIYGNALTNSGSSGPSFDLPAQTLLVAGTYTIKIDPSGTNTGSISASVTSGGTGTPGVPDITTTITAGGAPVTVTTTQSNQNARLTFTGSFGQKVSVNFSGNTIGPNYTYVYLLKPDGSVVTSTYFPQNGTTFFDTQTLSASGTYTILVDPQGTDTGSMTVQLNNAADASGGTVTIGGSPVTVITTTSGQSARLTFSGTAGGRISLRATNVTIVSSYLSIYNPDGTPLSLNNYIGTGGGFVDALTLPATGTYTIIVDPQSTYTGTMTLQLYSVPSDNAGAIVLGTPVTVTTTQPGQNARLTFTGSYGQKVSVNFSGNTIGPNYTYVYLLRPDGSVITSSYFPQNGTLYFDAQTLSLAGTYTILVDPQSTDTGSMTVLLNNATDVNGGTVTVGGAAVAVTTTQPGQNARLTFSGTQGQRVTFNVSAVTLAGTYVYVQNPDGSQLASVYSGTGGAFIDTQTLPATGTYTIFVDPSSTYTGSATLQLYSVPSDNAGAIVLGTPVTVTTTQPGQNARLTFTGSVGQKVSVNFSGNTIGPNYTYVYLLKPDGSAVTSTYFPQSGTAFFDIQTLPVPGTYTILVDPQGTDAGSMTVLLNNTTDVSAGTIVIGGAAVTATTTQPGQSARLTFSGTAGGRISLRATNVSITSGYISIYNPDGSALSVNNYIGTGGGFIDALTLPATGTYTIIVDPSSTYTGSATLQLYSVPSENAGSIAAGTPVTVTATVPGHNQRLTFTGTFGQKVSVNFSTNTIPNYTYVYLLKPDGSQLTSTYFSQGGTAFFDTQVLPVPGTYTILVDPQDVNTGSMTVALNDATDVNAGALIINGAAVGVTTTVPGQSARLTFSGTAGQQVTGQISNNTMSTVTVSVFNPDGSLLTTLSGSAASFAVPIPVLPASGTYTIIVDPSGTNTGTMNLSLTNP